MAKEKKSFILYSDLLDRIEVLTIEERGVLFTHLLEYVNDLNPVLTDRLLLTAWKPIELELKRDLEKYKEVKENKANGGRLGNLKRWNEDLYYDVISKKITLEEAEKIAISRKLSHTDTKLSHTIASIAVNDSVNVNDINNITVSNESDTLLIDDQLPNSFNPIYFTIAKAYHNLFLKTKGENKTLLNVTTKSYVDTIRKLIELDGLTIEQLVAIKLFLEDGSNGVRGVDTFWAETIYSVNSLRKKNKDGIFYFDMIAQKAKKWIEMDGNKTRVKNAVEYVNSLKCKNQE